jgi:class 3 adenylate cyclase
MGSAQRVFADISDFSMADCRHDARRNTRLVTNFFAWISAEAPLNTNAVVDKHIGDEVMVVYSREFGSDDPFPGRRACCTTNVRTRRIGIRAAHRHRVAAGDCWLCRHPVAPRLLGLGAQVASGTLRWGPGQIAEARSELPTPRQLLMIRASQ